ncbi:hypothetical protein [Saccharopolyspora rhizosphaerae]|nr:hypothetical protein [Saccharopolyspora rhizosphaerae]
MWPTEDPHEQLRWRIACATASGSGNVTVLVMGDRVGIVLPPGDTLIFTAEEAEGLANLVDEAKGCTAVPR